MALRSGRGLDNAYDFIVHEMDAFTEALDNEADRRLYVRPTLTASELLILHGAHCSSVIHGQPKPAAIAEGLSMSTGHVRNVISQLRERGFLDERGQGTKGLGLVGVSVVQYVHSAWIDKHFAHLLSEEKLAAMRKCSRVSFLPVLIGELHASMKLLSSKLGSASTEKLVTEDAMLLVLLADFGEYEKRSPGARELAVLSRTDLKTIYNRADTLRKHGLITRIDFDLTTKGHDRVKAFRKASGEWVVDIRARLLDP